MYPLSVLATNRALDTVISRKTWSRRSIVWDIKDIFGLGKFKALYAGIIPAMVIFSLDSGCLYHQEYISPYTGQQDDQNYMSIEGTENITSRAFTLTNLGAGLFGVNSIILTRMQCADFTYRNKLLKTLGDMLRHDRLWMFVRGFPAFLFYWLGFGVGVAYSRDLLIDLYE